MRDDGIHFSPSETSEGVAEQSGGGGLQADRPRKASGLVKWDANQSHFNAKDWLLRIAGFQLDAGLLLMMQGA